MKTSHKYYSIGQVSKIVDIKEHVLRFWEKEFPHLSPEKSSNGHRRYYDKDIRVIERIKDLLYTEKFTVSGAKLQLAEEIDGIQSHDREVGTMTATKVTEQTQKEFKISSMSKNEKQKVVAQLKEIVQLLK